jgi:sugar lactone lactonase YvrE
MEITQDGQITNTMHGLTAVLGIALDAEGRLYALETTTVNGQFPVPGSGRVVRINEESGKLEEIATGLALPTGMTFGPDGMLYVSNYGFGFPPGSGQVVKIQLP